MFVEDLDNLWFIILQLVFERQTSGDLKFNSSRAQKRRWDIFSERAFVASIPGRHKPAPCLLGKIIKLFGNLRELSLGRLKTTKKFIEWSKKRSKHVFNSWNIFHVQHWNVYSLLTKRRLSGIPKLLFIFNSSQTVHKSIPGRMKSFESVKKSNLGAGRKTHNDILNVFCLIFFFCSAFRRVLENMIITS